MDSNATHENVGGIFYANNNKYSGYLDQDNNLSVDLCIRKIFG